MGVGKGARSEGGGEGGVSGFEDFAGRGGVSISLFDRLYGPQGLMRGEGTYA